MNCLRKKIKTVYGIFAKYSRIFCLWILIRCRIIVINLKPTTMETSKILTADSLDILFDGRNKEYGAYDLRKTYNDRIKISITGMFLVCAFCLGASLFANSKEKTKNELVITDMELMKVKDETKVEPPPPPPPPKVEPPKWRCRNLLHL